MRPPSKLCIPEFLALLACVLLGLALRAGLCFREWNDRSDPDVYIALAQGIQAGRGFSTPGTSNPTAFRPPLYPLLLAAFRGDAPRPRCLLHLGLAAVMLLLIWLTARHLQLGLRGQCIATALAAVDPLLLRYSSLPMTETLAAALAAALLWLCASPRCWNWKRAAGTGAIFGLAVLCRPTFWIFGGMLSAAAGVWVIAQSRRVQSPAGDEPVATRFPAIRHWGIAAVFCGMVIAPWVLRNWLVMGTPIVMTTHGGYTLALGNNPSFYDEVVRQPWGTIWDGSYGDGQPGWAHHIVTEMARLQLTTEVQQDQWLQRQALATIRERPADFLKACVLKFTWFWNVGPQTETTGATPASVIWGIRIYYSIMWVVLLAGVWRVLGRIRSACGVHWPREAIGTVQDLSEFPLTPALSPEYRGEGEFTSMQTRDTGTAAIPRASPSETGLLGWVAVLALVAAFTAMHLVYWSDARMRAPIVPAIALLCAAALGGRASAKSADLAQT